MGKADRKAKPGQAKRMLAECKLWRQVIAATRGLMPIVIFRKLTGLQHKSVMDLAERYGLPVTGPAIDLAAFGKWLPEACAAKATRTEDEIDRRTREATARLREAGAVKAEMNNRRQRRLLVEARLVNEVFGHLRDILAQTATQIGQLHGPAAELLEQNLERMAAVVKREFAAAAEAEAGEDAPAEGGDVVVAPDGSDEATQRRSDAGQSDEAKEQAA